MATPLLNGPSLGYGIGLSATPDTEGYSLAARGIQMREAQRQRAALAKRKAEDDIRELGVKPPVVQALYQPAVNSSVANFARTAFEATKSGHPDAYYKVKDQQYQTQAELNDKIEKSKYVDTVLKDMDNAKQLGLMSPEAQSGFAAITAGDHEALKKIKDPTGRLTYDANSEVPHYRQAAPIVTSQFEDSLIKNPNYFSSLSSYQNKEYHNPKGGIETFNAFAIPATRQEAMDTQKKFGIAAPVTSIEDLRDLAIQNPAFRDNKETELINTGSLPKNYLELSPESRDKKFSDAVYKDLAVKAGVKIKENVQNPNAPRQDNSLNKEQIESALKDKNVYKKRSGESITAYFSPALAKPVTAVIPSAETEGVIDGDSFQHVKFPGIVAKWNLGAPQGMVTDKKSGQPVDDVVVDRLKAEGKLTRDKYKIALFSHATGEVESPGQLSEAQKRAISSSFFPVSSVRSPLQKSGVNFNEYDKKVKEKEDEVFGTSTESAPSEAPSPKKKSAKEYGL